MKNDALKVHELLGGLFEKPCSSSRKKFNRQIYKASVVFGRYVNDAGDLLGVVLADAAFVRVTAAAIMMMSPAVAKDARDEDELPEELCEAFGEVLNILSRLLNASGRPHCRYASADHGIAPNDIESFVRASSAREAFGFEICDYGEGTLSLVWA